jgi:hypothetical protein
MFLILSHPGEFLFGFGINNTYLQIGVGFWTLMIKVIPEARSSTFRFKLLKEKFYIRFGFSHSLIFGSLVQRCGCFRISFGPFYMTSGLQHADELEQIQDEMQKFKEQLGVESADIINQVKELEKPETAVPHTKYKDHTRKRR